jgi:hypothetical protein
MITFCAMLQIALPQDSRDKVTWWENLLQHLERRDIRRKRARSTHQCGHPTSRRKQRAPGDEVDG